VPTGLPIDEYSPAQLEAMVRWVESDTRLRTEDALLDEIVEALGFARRGSRIEAAIRTAIRTARP
jgi:hypothetical protein